MKKNIIFISIHLPSLLVPEAGQKLAYSRLLRLSKEYNVHLISFVNALEEKYINANDYSFCENVYLFKISNFNRIVNMALNFQLPITVGVRKDPRVTSCIKRILNEYDVSLFHVEYEQGLVYIPHGFMDMSTVVLHDIMSQSVSRFLNNSHNALKKIFLTNQLSLMNHFENDYFNKISQIIVLNTKDQVLVGNIINSSDNVIIDYPEVSEKFNQIKRDAQDIESNSIMFWGAMNRKENVDAVFWFVHDIFPAILEKIPNAKFYIVGANPTEQIIELNSNNIIVTGFVDDPAVYFEKVKISVVPLRYGAGIKIKVLETLSARIPTISTSVGAEGVIDTDGLLFVVDDAFSFSEQVINTLQDTIIR